jgi:hypothetical protein
LDASHCAAIAGAVALGAVELAEIVEELDVIGTRPAEAAFFHYTSHSSRNRPSKSSTDPTDPSRPQFPMIRRKSPTVSRGAASRTTASNRSVGERQLPQAEGQAEVAAQANSA